MSTETLGRLALEQHDPTCVAGRGPVPEAHGWNAYDIEPGSTDFLFDYHTLTGDHRTLDELRNMGESLMGTLRQTYYYSAYVVLAARGEGWCMRPSCRRISRPRRQVQGRRDRPRPRPDRSETGKNHPSRAFVFQTTRTKSPYRPNLLHGVAARPGRLRVLRGTQVLRTPVCSSDRPGRRAGGHLFMGLNVSDPIFGFVQNGCAHLSGHVPEPPIPPTTSTRRRTSDHLGCGPLGGAHTFLIGART